MLSQFLNPLAVLIFVSLIYLYRLHILLGLKIMGSSISYLYYNLLSKMFIEKRGRNYILSFFLDEKLHKIIFRKNRFIEYFEVNIDGIDITDQVEPYILGTSIILIKNISVEDITERKSDNVVLINGENTEQIKSNENIFINY